MPQLLSTFILSILFSLQLSSFELMPEMPDYQIIADEIDESLWLHQSKITVLVTSNDLLTGNSIQYGYEDFSKSKEMNDNQQFEFRLRPGEYEFAFYAEAGFQEIFTNKIKIEARHHITIRLNFKSTTRNELVKKPVIYLYSQTPTQALVHVAPKGEFTFTYPPANNGEWNITLDSSGITVGEEHLNYLFWEAEQAIDQSAFDYSSGYILKNSEVQTFLHDALEAYGLKSTEIADFVTFWGPELIKHKSVFLQFVVDDDCDQFGELRVTPEPESMHRIYLLWAANPDLNVAPVPQSFERFERKSFDVLEWGGVQINNDREL